MPNRAASEGEGGGHPPPPAPRQVGTSDKPFPARNDYARGVIETGWWNWPGFPTAEEWTAWWGFLAFIVTGGAAVAALIQLRAYLGEREERARPFVIVDYHFRSVLLQVEVQNSSGTIATDVILQVTPPFGSNSQRDADALNARMGEGYVIRQLAPGRSIRWTLDRAPEYFENEDLPRTYEVVVKYTDPRFQRRPLLRWWLPSMPARYEDSFTLDIDQWSLASAEVDYDNKNWNSLDRIDRSLRKIADKLK